jgi:hypothetical protein
LPEQLARQRRYQFGPLQQPGVVGMLRVGQLLIVATAAALALLALYILRDFFGLLIGLLALMGAGAMIFLPVEGRTLDEWAPIVIRWARRSRANQRGYRSVGPSSGMSLDGQDSASAHSLPAELADLDLLEVLYGQDEVGVLRDRNIGSYTAVIAVRAGAFGLRDPSEQERKLDAWGAVLASAARDGSPVRRLQWIERTLPAQGDELAAHLQAERDRSVPLDSNLVRSYIELVESAAPATQEHEILVALQIDQHRGAKELKRLGGGDEGACELLLREAESFAERLSVADITVFGVLPPRQYAELVRDGFDPYGRRGRARAALRDQSREGVDPARMGPFADQTTWGHYRSDSALHVTYWIASWPRSDVGPAFLAPLLMQTRAVRTMAVTIEPIPYSISMRKAEAAQTAEVAEEIQRDRQGFMTTARLRRRQQATARREEELADGHAEMRFAGYVTVSGASSEDLDRSCSDVEHSAQLARLELQRLYGEQDVGFTFTLPLCRGLA